MSSRAFLLATAFLFTAVTPGLAQGRNGGRGPGGGFRAALNPVAYLIENGEKLSLTEQQTSALRTLADSLDAESAPDREKLEAARGSGDRSQFEGLRSVMEGIRARNDAYVEKAKGLLTEEQIPVAEELLQEIAPRGRGRGGRGGPGR